MIPLATLKATVQRALRQVGRAKDVREAEVFASSIGQLICRLNYTSEIPCNGVEEPKSMESHGISVRALFDGPDGPRLGFGSEARDLSLHGIHQAFEKARRSTVRDPEFTSFPAAPQSERSNTRYHDRAIMEVKDRTLVESGWKVIHEALKVFSSSEPLVRLAGSKDKAPSLGLVVSGDVSLFRQRMAIASTRMPKVRTDESTLITSFVTAMVERHNAKGTGYGASSILSAFKGEAGAEAARNAIRGVRGQRLPTGNYPVVLGPQPVADLMINLILPSLSADAFYSSRSAFVGELGRPVAAPALNIYDHGAGRGFAGSKSLTCEGLPTGRTDLIQGGVLTGLLCNHYESQRLLHDPRAREKLGVNPQEHAEALVPRNGFRVSNMGRRTFDALPSIAATNAFIESTAPQTLDTLLRTVGNGVYVGRIWYTYAINGLRAGDFTCTVVGDSYLIQDGRLAAPLQANTIRMTGNIRRLLQNVIGVTRQTRPILEWSNDEIIYAPEIAVRDVQLYEIAQFMQAV